MESLNRPTGASPGAKPARQLTRVHLLTSALIAVSIASLLGCEYTPPGPPSHFPQARVKGKILMGGQPQAGAWVTVLPLEGALGRHREARTGADGSFEIADAPVGKLQVRIDTPRSLRREFAAKKSPVANRLELFRGPGSPLLFDSSRSANTPLEVDLLAPIPVPKERRD